MSPTIAGLETFVYTSQPARVVFGSGHVRRLPDELARLSLKLPLILSTPNQVDQAEMINGILNGQSAGIYSKAAMHTPVDVTEDAMKSVQGADSIVSVGGGSTIGLGKALSIRTGLPHICIPTTYAGSEMTPILGESADGRKVTRSDPKILPGTVIYDVDLTLSLPAAVSSTSGVNALAHAVEAFDGDAIKGLNVLLDRLKVKKGLKDFGFREEDIDKATDIALEKPYWNPRPIEREAIRELIRRCYAGEPARADF
ncbi:hypothetical protein KEM52_006065 [Ascosphaera acerosa]|nr:hypothetical protein KEM52_006065 [Ascosphaera acerosa]